MHLIIDSGATKAIWVAASGGKELCRVETPGLSPYFLSDAQIRDYAEGVLNQLEDDPEAVYFYGTGCQAAESRRRLTRVFQDVFPSARSVGVDTDMLGAARAVCKNSAGMCAILGTGSNACCYDGATITDMIGGLGFVLGDEGSGAVLGRTLLSSYLNRLLPVDLCQALEAFRPLSRDSILEAVYRGPTPSRFLATFVPFLHQHQEHPFVWEMLAQEFGRFCTSNLLVMAECRNLPVHFIGSVAFHFQVHVEAAAKKAGLHPKSFHVDPMAGLIAYHE